jgi:hypothetical protein
MLTRIFSSNLRSFSGQFSRTNPTCWLGVVEIRTLLESPRCVQYFAQLFFASISTKGLQLGLQLETAKEQFATTGTCRGIDENKCKKLQRNRQTSRRRSARVLLDTRLQKDEARARRHLRLRARIQSLPQIPIAAPVNFSGGQVSRNNTNSGIGRSDGLRTLLRRTACKVRGKVAFSYTKGTTHQCLLGNITKNKPRKVTGPRRRLAMCGFSSEMGHPLKNNQKKTANPDGNRFAKHAAYPETKLASGAPASRQHGSRYLGLLNAAAPWAPVRCTHRFAGERITASLGTPERNKAEPDVIRWRYLGLFGESDSWAPVRCTHRFAGERIIASLGTPERNKAEPDVIADGVWLSFHSPVLPQILTLSALDRPVKGALRGYNP